MQALTGRGSLSPNRRLPSKAPINPFPPRIRTKSRERGAKAEVTLVPFRVMTQDHTIAEGPIRQ